MRTPSGPTCFVSTSRRSLISPKSPKRRLPLPTTTGWTISRYSSTRSCSISVLASSPLPKTRMSLPSCCLSLATSSSMSPSIRVEFSTPAAPGGSSMPRAWDSRSSRRRNRTLPPPSGVTRRRILRTSPVPRGGRRPRPARRARTCPLRSTLGAERPASPVEPSSAARVFDDAVQRHELRDDYSSHGDLLGVVFALHTYDELTTAESTTPAKYFGFSSVSSCDHAPALAYRNVGPESLPEVRR